MRVDWEQGNGGSGLSAGRIDFERPRLDPYRWPIIQIRGGRPGPRLCVMAGVHVNESSSIVAAATLCQHLATEEMSGVVAVIPLVNQPAEYRRVKEIPVDNKNIHEFYPGRPDGTFSEVLAHALLFDWAADAEVLIDLHGGDFGQNLVHPFVVVQRIGDAELDGRNEALARCFEPRFLVSLEPGLASRPGRVCSALARVGRSGLVVEAGACGAVDGRYIDFHVHGVLNVARRLGILPGPRPAPQGRPAVLDRYLFVDAPVDGFVFPEVESGDRVAQGQRVARMCDDLQRPIAQALAPADGYITWRTTQVLAKAGSRIVAMGRVMRA